MRQTTSYEWITWLTKIRSGSLPEKAIADLSADVEEITHNFSPETQAEKWGNKAKAAEDLANGNTKRERTLELTRNPRRKGNTDKILFGPFGPK